MRSEQTVLNDLFDAAGGASVSTMHRLLLASLLTACVTTGNLRQRAEQLEASAATCESFTSFDATLAKERHALDTAPGDELVPASRALNAARRGCAVHLIDGLFELQQRHGREAAAKELEAIAHAFGVEETTSLLRTRWKNEADGFLGEVIAAGTPTRTTPTQAAPGDPVDPHPERPDFPGSAAFGEGAECLRQSDLDAARCLRTWRLDGADAKEVDQATSTLVTRVKKGLTGASDDERARTCADVLRALGLPSHATQAKALVEELERAAESLLRRAETFAKEGAPERSAVVVRPLVGVDSLRLRAEPFSRAAADLHAALAREAGARRNAVLLHRAQANWLLGLDDELAPLDAGRWDTARWDCTFRQPRWPTLPATMEARLVARCRTVTPPKRSDPVDPAMRTFDFEKSLPRLQLDAELSLTCAGVVTTKRLSADEVLLDGDERDTSSRPHPLDSPLAKAVSEAALTCREALSKEAAKACAALNDPPLDVEERFTRLARHLGRWEPCFIEWESRRTATPLPALPRSPADGSRREDRPRRDWQE